MGMQTYGQATGATLAQTLWSDYMMRSSAEAAAQDQFSAAGSAAWQQMKQDPLLSSVLETDNFEADIEKVLGVGAR